jgi:hypothetical protein
MSRRPRIRLQIEQLEVRYVPSYLVENYGPWYTNDFGTAPGLHTPIYQYTANDHP